MLDIYFIKILKAFVAQEEHKKNVHPNRGVDQNGEIASDQLSNSPQVFDGELNVVHNSQGKYSPTVLLYNFVPKS